GLIATGTADPTNGCEICQPGTLATGYSPVNDATPCQTNGNYCKAGACIFGCYVGGKLFDAGDSSPTNVCDVCAASTVGQPVMAFSPTTVTTQCNENGGTYCAQGACIPVCLIGATFYDAGAPDPTDPDQCCNPATPGAWTPGFASAITTPSTTGTPAAVAIGDVTGDGIPDLIVGETPPGQVEILKGAGDGTFSLLPNPIAFPTGASSLVVADFNNDGYQDLAVASNGGNSITILLYEADGGFVSSSMNDIFKKPIALLVADLQQPGSHDLIVGAANSALVPEVVTLINQGGSFTLGSTATLVDGVVALTPGDFNGQSNEVDVAALGAHGVTIVAITGAGTTITPGVPVPLTTSNVVAGASGNLDGHPNGVSDLAVADAQNNQVIPLLNGSSGLAAQAALAVNAPTAAAVADLNGDGKPDVAAAGTSVGGTSDVLVFINQTVGSASSLTFFTPVGAYVVGAQPVALAVGDLNGDGRPDLVTASGGNDNLSVLLGQCP
ncbi:MAG TPA: VCBS repeat-containing protein, partial [Myxococcales bacterium]|nr:VCBS repeat-containing protein [Myxococcales bacterium]